MMIATKSRRHEGRTTISAEPAEIAEGRADSLSATPTGRGSLDLWVLCGLRGEALVRVPRLLNVFLVT